MTSSRTRLNIKPVIGECAICRQPLDSRKHRSRNSVIYVIGELLACSQAHADWIEQSTGTEDWPQRLAVYLFDIDGYDSLPDEDKQLCDDAAEWARQRVAEVQM